MLCVSGKGRRPAVGRTSILMCICLQNFCTVLTWLYFTTISFVWLRKSRPRTGVAIRGYISAQKSSAVLMEAESIVPWGSILPPKVKLCRFRDNINCRCATTDLLYWIHTLMGTPTSTYHIFMTVEQARLSVTFLQVQVLCQGTHLRWGFKNKLINSMLTSGSTITGYRDPNEPHTRRLVNSIATALCNLAVQIATGQELIITNVSQVVLGMEISSLESRDASTPLTCGHTKWCDKQ